MKRLLSVVAALVLAMASLALAAPAQSSSQSSSQTSSQTSSRPAGRASGPAWRAVITFDKSEAHQFDSRLIWRLYQGQGKTWKLVQQQSWRAGSGLPGPRGEDTCATSRGWLPNGTYRMREYDHYNGSVIKGRVFYLDNKACPSGRVRHDLFIHSEQTAGNRQCPNRPGDQPCRWEFPRINDYKSLGCIKMAPRDIAALTALFHRHFASGVRYSADRVSLQVTS